MNRSFLAASFDGEASLLSRSTRGSPRGSTVRVTSSSARLSPKSLVTCKASSITPLSISPALEQFEAVDFVKGGVRALVKLQESTSKDSDRGSQTSQMPFRHNDVGAQRCAAKRAQDEADRAGSRLDAPRSRAISASTHVAFAPSHDVHCRTERGGDVPSSLRNPTSHER